MLETIRLVQLLDQEPSTTGDSTVRHLDNNTDRKLDGWLGNYSAEAIVSVPCMCTQYSNQNIVIWMV